MKRIKLSIIIMIISTISIFGQNEEVFYAVFEEENVSTKEWNEGSPSSTLDGKTLVFTRYKDYDKKIPFIANWREGEWKVKRLEFTDYVYNIGISADGNEIYYRIKKIVDGDKEYTSYRIKKNQNKWATPKTFQNETIRSKGGYFSQAEDKTLYIYMYVEGRKGIYYSKLSAQDIYQDPVWLSDAVSIYPSMAFSPLINKDQTKIIVARDGLYSDDKKALAGPMGLYYHQKHGMKWDGGKRLNLPYSVSATVLFDNQFLFKHKGDFYMADLNDLQISW